MIGAATQIGWCVRCVAGSVVLVMALVALAGLRGAVAAEGPSPATKSTEPPVAAKTPDTQTDTTDFICLAPSGRSSSACTFPLMGSQRRTCGRPSRGGFSARSTRTRTAFGRQGAQKPSHAANASNRRARSGGPRKPLRQQPRLSPKMDESPSPRGLAFCFRRSAAR